MAGTTAQPLDASFYRLDRDPNQLLFYKRQTGISDDEELKKHIIAVQTEAYKIHPYGCIRMFSFLSRSTDNPISYQEAVKLLGRTRPDAIYLDIGCCFGADLHHVVADGWKPENAIASDLHSEYWSLGHKLFRSTPESFPVHFIAGDIFFDKLFDIKEENLPEPPKPLSSLTSLTPLKGHVSVIHASSFFHLFPLDPLKVLCKVFDALLSLEPGSIVYGSNWGALEGEDGPRREGRVYLHSTISWKTMWEQAVGEGKLVYDTQVFPLPGVYNKEYSERTGGGQLYWMVWIIKRV